MLNTSWFRDENDRDNDITSRRLRSNRSVKSTRRAKSQKKTNRKNKIKDKDEQNKNGVVEPEIKYL